MSDLEPADHDVMLDADAVRLVLRREQAGSLNSSNISGRPG